MIYAVIDTTVLVSALITKNPEAATAKVVRLLLDNGFVSLYDADIFPENKMAILKEEDAYRAFKKAMKEHDDISTVFIITDSDGDFREMSADFSGKKCYQLYRDYLDNFSINYERN